MESAYVELIKMLLHLLLQWLRLKFSLRQRNIGLSLLYFLFGSLYRASYIGIRCISCQRGQQYFQFLQSFNGSVVVLLMMP